jgi:hypothetical protein
MKRITSEEARALRRQGVKLTTEDGKPFIPRPVVRQASPVEKEPEKPKTDDFIKDTMKSLITVITANELTMSKVVDIEGALAEVGGKIANVFSEMNKQKPKKNLDLIIGRDKKGDIDRIQVKEL